MTAIDAKYDGISDFELLGKMPKKFALSGKNSNKYFTKTGELRRIRGLQYFYLKDVLNKKYKIKYNEAKALADFLLPMLEYYPEKRASARQRACSSKFCGSFPLSAATASAFCSSIFACASAGV